MTMNAESWPTTLLPRAVLVLFAALALSLLGVPGWAQARADVSITAPADGEAVETPFTVEGIAPPGARLELYVAGRLERVFRANSEGRFRAAVTRQIGPDTTIAVNLLDRAGDKLASSTIRVNDGGARAPIVVEAPPAVEPVAPPPVLEPVAPPPVLDPNAAGGLTTGAPSPDAPADMISGGNAPPSADLPAETPGGAPVPPPPADLAPAAASETTPDVGVQDGPAPPPPVLGKGPSRGIRITGESVGGLVGGLAVGAVGLFGGLLVGAAVDPGGYAILGYIAVGTVGGFFVGIPLGVAATGYALDGNGSWAFAYLGGLGGLLGGGLIGALFSAIAPELTAIFVVGGTIAGSIAGYELTSDPSRKAIERERRWQSQQATVAPLFGVSSEGTPTFGLTLSF